MANEDNTKLKCLLLTTFSNEFDAVRDAVNEAAKKADFHLLGSELGPIFTSDRGWTKNTLPQADIVIADITGKDIDVIYEIGLAAGVGKAVIIIVQQKFFEESLEHVPTGLPFQVYVPTRKGLQELTSFLHRQLNNFAVNPNKFKGRFGVKPTETFFVDWDKLDERDIENLCRELLMQMGFRNVDWSKRTPLIDIIAEYPKKDPDGFEYSDFWFISMGRKFPVEEIVFMASRESEYMLRDILRENERGSSALSRYTITFLLILLDDYPKIKESIQREWKIRENHSRALASRLRFWDKSYLTFLVQQYPQIGYKYFSDEGFSRLKYRKTPEELYKENTQLSNRQARLIAELQEEKNMRVRAERDAAWKDISFSAAHKIGNPIFAIETNLNPLKRRVEENRKEEALDIISSIRTSVEKAKGIVEQFKSLTRAQEINPVPTLLKPIIEASCKAAQSCSVTCEIDSPDDLKVDADPERLGECFDELASNTIHWLDKEEKKIQIQVINPAPFVPSNLDSSRQYVLIHFKDNGSGVQIENKEKIFDAFFSTRSHGTGLGLALVRRIIEGHGGAISEVGIPNEGADFEIYLPLPSDKIVKRPRRRKKE